MTYKPTPEEVEAALKAVDGVEDAVILGVPDERFGERVGAVVQWSGTPRGFEELDAALRSSLAGYKVPAAYWVVDAVGRHPSRKTDYGWARRLVADRAPAVSDRGHRPDGAGSGRR